MKPLDITDELEGIAGTPDFSARCEELTDSWSAAHVGLESVEPILRFIEAHPSLDYGMPGALVHFVERFHGNGYEDRLVESVARRPTTLTTWMLNRVVNGTKDPAARARFAGVMQSARTNPSADPAARSLAAQLLDRSSRE